MDDELYNISWTSNLHEILKSSQSNGYSPSNNHSLSDSKNIFNSVPLGLEQNAYISKFDDVTRNKRNLQMNCSLDDAGSGTTNKVLSYPSTMKNHKLKLKPPTGSLKRNRRNAKKYSFLIDDTKDIKDKSNLVTKKDNSNVISLKSDKDYSFQSKNCSEPSASDDKNFKEIPVSRLTSSKRSHSLNFSEVIQQKGPHFLDCQDDKVGTHNIQ